jgi:hypothetical protein
MLTPTDETIARNIKRLLGNRSARWLARESKVPTMRVWRTLTRKRASKPSDLPAIAAALGVAVADLFECPSPRKKTGS